MIRGKKRLCRLNIMGEGMAGSNPLALDGVPPSSATPEKFVKPDLMGLKAL